jgi:hypothetical protein
MEILINDEKIDFKLEAEKNLGEIVRGLEEWVLKNGHVIESISVDNRVIPVDFNSSEFKSEISAIKELKVVVSDHVKLALKTFLTVGEYINKVLRDYTGPDSIKHYDSLLEGLNLVYNGIMNSLKILRIRAIAVVNDDSSVLDEALLEMNEFIRVYEKKYPDAEGIARLKILLKKMLDFLPEIYKWAVIKNYSSVQKQEKVKVSAYLKDIFHDLQSLIMHSIHRFAEIGKNLQIGEDRKALNDLFYLMELLDEVISLLKITDEIYSISQKLEKDSENFIEVLFHKMTGCLKEVENAFENADMITVGDILEYEIKPIVERFPDLFRKIDEFIA